MTHDFAAFILQTPEAERHGRVFRLNGLQTCKPITPKRVCRLISKFGKVAGVVVNKAEAMREVCQCSRPAAGVRYALGFPRQAGGSTAANASCEHRNHDGLLCCPRRGRRGGRALGSSFGPTYNNAYNKAPRQSQTTETAPAKSSTEALTVQ